MCVMPNCPFLTDLMSLLQKVKNGMVGDTLECVMTETDTLVGKAALTSGLLLGSSEVLKSLRRTNCRHKAKDMTPLVARRERRGKRKRLTTFLERTREGHHQSDEHWNCFKGNVGKLYLLRDRVEYMWAFPAHKYHLELN